MQAVVFRVCAELKEAGKVVYAWYVNVVSAEQEKLRT